MMRIACADYTWPLLEHDVALAVIAGMGFEAADIGLFAGRSHIRPEGLGPEPERAGQRLEQRLFANGLEASDVFAQFTEDFVTGAVNHPDEQVRRRTRDHFDRACAFAAAAGSSGLTILPGVHVPGESWDVSAARAADELEALSATALDAGLVLSVEPHVESVIDTPAKTSMLLAMAPSVRLTIDYGHYVFIGTDQAAVHELLPAVRHVQARGGAVGVLQTPVAESEIDFASMVEQLQRVGYNGFVACEYVWSDWHDCNRCDNTSETALLRDVLKRAITDGQGR